MNILTISIGQLGRLLTVVGIVPALTEFDAINAGIPIPVL